MKTIIAISKKTYIKEVLTKEGYRIEKKEHDILLLKDELQRLSKEVAQDDSEMLLEILRGAFKKLGTRVLAFEKNNLQKGEGNGRAI